MTIVDLVFPVLGTTIPAQHGYQLYGCLSRLIPALHTGDTDFGLSAITGRFVGNGRLQVEPNWSVMRIRISTDHIPSVLPLAGKPLDLHGSRVRLGVPRVEALEPAGELISHFVTIKNADTPEKFLASAAAKLEELGVRGDIRIPVMHTGPHQGEPKRHVQRIKDKVIVGFEMLVSGLSPNDSLKLQQASNFSRRRLGAAFFMPKRND